MNFYCYLLFVALAFLAIVATVVDQVAASRRFEKGVLLGYLLAQQRGGYGNYGGGYGGYGGF